MARVARLQSPNATLGQELHDALIGTMLRLGCAMLRLDRHRRRRGNDYRCQRLRDEVHLARSLLFVLDEEARALGRRPTAPG
jgi:hypothetical protein